MADTHLEAVAEAIREHQLGYEKGRGFLCISIICDWEGHDLDFPEHQAQAVIDALQLTPEWAVRRRGESWPWHMCANERNANRIVLNSERNNDDKVSRLVSPWVDVGTQPATEEGR